MGTWEGTEILLLIGCGPVQSIEGEPAHPPLAFNKFLPCSVGGGASGKRERPYLKVLIQPVSSNNPGVAFPDSQERLSDDCLLVAAVPRMWPWDGEANRRLRGRCSDLRVGRVLTDTDFTPRSPQDIGPFTDEGLEELRGRPASVYLHCCQCPQMS